MGCGKDNERPRTEGVRPICAASAMARGARPEPATGERVRTRPERRPGW